MAHKLVWLFLIQAPPSTQNSPVQYLAMPNTVATVFGDEKMINNLSVCIRKSFIPSHAIDTDC